MKRLHTTLILFVLAFAGLLVCIGTLWYQTERFSSSAETLADDVRVSLIGLDGHVAYDTEGSSLPNHADRAEVEAVLKDGKPRTVIRPSTTLGRTMLYHARRVGDQIVRIAVPQTAVDSTRTHARNGLVAAGAVGAFMIAILFLFAHRTARRADKLAAERDAQEKVVDELRKLEQFRSDFISNITHEIKTPLTGILGAVEILSDKTAQIDDQDRADLHQVLHNQSARLNALVDDILALAQLEKSEAEHTAEFSPCRIADIVQTAVNLVQPQAIQTGTKITFNPSDPDVVRACDPRLIESAIANLLQNALRYSGSQDIEIDVTSSPSGKAVVSVADHGIGIPAECQPRLFERFYRVDKDRSRSLGGTGLGLAIVKHIVQLHHGEVSVSSTPGHGAKFTITI